MKRLVTILLLVAALAASTALAQAQRWEYATLVISAQGFPRTYEDARTNVALNLSWRQLADVLIPRYGQPPDLLVNETPVIGYSENNFLNILGYGGWEIVAIRTNEASDRIYLFKRPLQD